MWKRTIAAPASRQAIVSATSSSVGLGTFGLRRFDVAPLIAASMITAAATPEVSPAARGHDDPVTARTQLGGSGGDRNERCGRQPAV